MCIYICMYVFYILYIYMQYFLLDIQKLCLQRLRQDIHEQKRMQNGQPSWDGLMLAPTGGGKIKAETGLGIEFGKERRVSHPLKK